VVPDKGEEMSKNSSPPQEDMRIRRTKKQIWEALLSLLQEQTFAATSVSAICEQAMVHRATFYCHFADKYALLEYGMQGAVQTIVKDLQWKDLQWKDLQWKEPIQKREAFILSMLEYMRTHQRLFSLLLHEEFATRFLRRLVSGFERGLTRPEGPMKQVAIPTSVLAQFYAGAVLHVMIWWVEQEMRMPSQELADYINRLLLPISS
jgi:AcrR family transcriptional regulator